MFTKDLGTFTAGADTTIYVAVDTRVVPVLPEWLADWTKTDDVLTASSDLTFVIYKKNFKSGEKVTLGMNGGNGNNTNYLVFATEENITIKGDVNMDGKFDIEDLVLLQKWLLAIPDTKLANWKAGDLCEDDKLNVFDLCLMKRELLNQKN